jgi:hypothetical protein
VSLAGEGDRSGRVGEVSERLLRSPWGAWMPHLATIEQTFASCQHRCRRPQVLRGHDRGGATLQMTANAGRHTEPADALGSKGVGQVRRTAAPAPTAAPAQERPPRPAARPAGWAPARRDGQAACAWRARPGSAACTRCRSHAPQPGLPQTVRRGCAAPSPTPGQTPSSARRHASALAEWCPALGQAPTAPSGERQQAPGDAGVRSPRTPYC